MDLTSDRTDTAMLIATGSEEDEIYMYKDIELTSELISHLLLKLYNMSHVALSSQKQ